MMTTLANTGNLNTHHSHPSLTSLTSVASLDDAGHERLHRMHETGGSAAKNLGSVEPSEDRTAASGGSMEVGRTVRL